MKPIFSVIGHSNTGKTTFIRALVRELHHRGYRVAVIKHDHLDHGEIDRKGSDTAQFWEEGCETVVLSSPSRLALFKRTGRDTPPEEIIPLCGEVDCVILEGYKSSAFPKIEIRRENEELPEADRRRLLAVVLEHEGEKEAQRQKVAPKVPLFLREETKEIAALLEKSILAGDWR